MAETRHDAGPERPWQSADPARSRWLRLSAWLALVTLLGTASLAEPGAAQPQEPEGAPTADPPSSAQALPTADPPAVVEEGPTAADKETARNLYRQGHLRYRGGDYHGALEAFGAADQIMGAPTTGLELGRTRAKLGLLVEARDRLLEVMRHPAQPGEPLPYTEARQEATVLADQIARRIPAIRLEVVGPAGAMTQNAAVELKIDGRAVPLELRSVARSMNPGAHVLEASAPGYVAQRQTVELAEGEQRVVRLVLTQPTNNHEPLKPPPEDPLVQPLMWTAFGVGGVGLVVGVVTGALTLSASSSLDEDCPQKRCPPDKQDDIDSAGTLGDVSTVSFIVGGAATLTGVVLALVSLATSEPDDPPQAADPSATLELQPLLGPGWLGLEGRF